MPEENGDSRSGQELGPVRGGGSVVAPLIPDHELIRKFDGGAYGEVWLAKSVTGVFRAVKVVRRSGLDGERPYHREFNGIRNFEPLSRTGESLVAVLHVGINETQGYFYYVMELADDARSLGGFAAEVPAPTFEFDAATYKSSTLAALLAEQHRLPFGACLDLGLAIGSGLLRLHSNGEVLVHRDISPRNILFVDRKPRLGDPGTMVASLYAKSLVGTPGFIPPEGPGTTRGDIYSAGKVLYVASTGLEASRCPELPLSLKGTPAWEGIIELNQVVQRACAIKPDERYRSVTEMLNDLGTLQQGRSLRLEARTRQRERRFRISIAALLALSVGALAWNWGYRKVVQNQLQGQQRRIEAGDRELALARKLIETERGAAYLRVDEEFAKGNAAMGVAQLAAILRQDPANELAAMRLMSALTDRNFPMPISAPMRHEGEVFWAEFSPVGDRIVTASADGTARVWNAMSGEPISPPLPHAGHVRFACFSPDGARIATASFDHTARVWNAATGVAVTPPLRHAAWVNRARFSPDGQWVATVSRDGTACFWDSTTGERKAELRIAKGEVYDCQFSPDGKRVVVGAEGSPTTVWEVGTWKPAFAPMADSRNAVSVVFSPDGDRIATASDDAVARLWNAHTGQPIGEPMQHGAQVRTVVFSPDGGRVVTASWDETAQVWEATTGKPITPPMKHADQVRAAVFSPDGLRVATASSDFTARVWDAWTGAPLIEAIRHGNKLRGVQFSREGARLLTISADKTARMWDIRNGASMAGPPSNQYLIQSHEYTKDGRISVRGTFTSQYKGTVLEDGRVNGVIQYQERINSTHVSGDGKWVVTASDDRTAQVWEIRSAKPVGNPLPHPAYVLQAEFSPDATRIVTASRDSEARLWSRSTGELLGAPMRHQGPLRDVEFSPDGSHVLTASDDGVARIWNGVNGNAMTAPMPHPEAVLFAQFSPDGRRVVTACKDFSVRIWDAQNGRPVTPALMQDAEIVFAMFSPDGRMIAISCEDRTVRIWDARSGESVSGPMRHPQPITHLAISPDGLRMATAVRPGTVRFWDVKTGLPLTEPRNLSQDVHWLEFSNDGTSLLVLGDAARVELQVPTPGQRPPSWLSTLAEEFLGGHWTRENSFVPSSGVGLREVRKRIGSSASQGYFELCARWMFEDRSTRTISPMAVGSSTAAHLRLILEGEVVGSLQDVLWVSPTNGPALARLAHRFREASENDGSKRAQALTLFDRAVDVAHADSETMYRVLDIASVDSLVAAHLKGFEKPLTVHSNSINLWIARGCLLQKTGLHTLASNAFEKSIELMTKDGRGMKVLGGDLLMDRAGVLRLMGKLEQAREACRDPNTFASRDDVANSSQIDLSNHYNASLRHRLNDRLVRGGGSLRALEGGTRTLQGIPYDIRGRVLLDSSHESQQDHLYPAVVKGIGIGRVASQFHILHGAEGAAESGTKVGHYLVHYIDGQTEEIQIVFGGNVWNMEDQLEKPLGDSEFDIAWESRPSTGPHGRLLHVLWKNPRPGIEISHLDFVSNMKEAAPFLVAITLE